PTLAICYGAQLAAKKFGGKVESSARREYGRAKLFVERPCALLAGVENETTVWMSHGDAIVEPPQGATVVAHTESVAVAAYEAPEKKLYAVQFHPEVTHTECGVRMMENFLFGICGAKKQWTAQAFVETTVAQLRERLGDARAVCALSGGVDSTVAAVLVQRAIGDRLVCVFIDNGLLRKDEFGAVQAQYRNLGLNLAAADASSEFLAALAGISDPEAKRKIIGAKFVEVFEREAGKIGAEFLVQGTIYPDVIESVSVAGPSATIKSHHNVGGLPAKMCLRVVEPLRYLFK
ncbi:MAG: gamma-glutamyl-gamma-aminobutyrate hydrolase family protein, partial [Bacteroidia bacterium]|nr:gamma-glutamyl-gamma-aminobutyrate hydrolase family protein [Bacteroidia bacterium]